MIRPNGEDLAPVRLRTDGERLAVLETVVDQLRAELVALRADQRAQLDEIRTTIAQSQDRVSRLLERAIVALLGGGGLFSISQFFGG